MAPTSAVISDMLNHLEEEDYRTAISFGIWREGRKIAQYVV